MKHPLEEIPNPFPAVDPLADTAEIEVPRCRECGKPILPIVAFCGDRCQEVYLQRQRDLKLCNGAVNAVRLSVLHEYRETLLWLEQHSATVEFKGDIQGKLERCESAIAGRL